MVRHHVECITAAAAAGDAATADTARVRVLVVVEEVMLVTLRGTVVRGAGYPGTGRREC